MSLAPELDPSRGQEYNQLLRSPGKCRKFDRSQLRQLSQNEGVDDFLIFLCAIRRQYTDVVFDLSLKPNFDPSRNNNLALRTAIKTDNKEIVELLTKITDPSQPDQIPVRNAIKFGFKNSLKILAADPRVDPTYNDWVGLSRAVEAKKDYVIKDLLDTGNRYILNPTTVVPSNVIQAIISYFIR